MRLRLLITFQGTLWWWLSMYLLVFSLKTVDTDHQFSFQMGWVLSPSWGYHFLFSLVDSTKYSKYSVTSMWYLKVKGGCLGGSVG